jgi:hypothetical protein
MRADNLRVRARLVPSSFARRTAARVVVGISADARSGLKGEFANKPGGAVLLTFPCCFATPPSVNEVNERGFERGAGPRGQY